MGCVATKAEISDIFRKKAFREEQTDSNNRLDEITRAESCQVSENSGRLVKQAISLRKSDKDDKHKIQNRSRRNSKTRDSNSHPFRLSGPGFFQQNYEVLCEQKSIPVFAHLIYGFPAENINILSLNSVQERILTRASRLSISSNSSQKDKEFNGIWSKAEKVNIILRQNVSIFVKLKVECSFCSKITKVTHCRAVLSLSLLNCNCKSDKVKITVQKTQPELLQIWSDYLNKIVPTSNFLSVEKPTREVKRKSKFRLFGCTSCWGFSNISRRSNCPCAVCDKCRCFACQICDR